MTTETRTPGPRAQDPGLRVLVRTAAAAAVLGGTLAVVAVLASGGAALLGVLAGLVLALAVFALGALGVYLVAGVMPSASLLFALVTYTLQVVAMLAAFALLDGSGAFGSTLDRQWFGIAVIVVTGAWLVAQIVLTTRARIPAFDVPARTPEASER